MRFATSILLQKPEGGNMQNKLIGEIVPACSAHEALGIACRNAIRDNQGYSIHTFTSILIPDLLSEELKNELP